MSSGQEVTIRWTRNSPPLSESRWNFEGMPLRFCPKQGLCIGMRTIIGIPEALRTLPQSPTGGEERHPHLKE